MEAIALPSCQESSSKGLEIGQSLEIDQDQDLNLDLNLNLELDMQIHSQTSSPVFQEWEWSKNFLPSSPFELTPVVCLCL